MLVIVVAKLLKGHHMFRIRQNSGLLETPPSKHAHIKASEESLYLILGDFDIRGGPQPTA